MNKLINNLKQTPLWLWILHSIVAIQLLAMSKPILVHSGSHVSRYLIKQTDIQQVKEDKSADSLDAIINGTATEQDFDQFNQIEPEPSQEKQASIRTFDRSVGYFLIILALATCFWRKKSWLLAIALCLASVWCVLDSISAVLNGGKAFSSMTPYSLAARSISPLLLAIIFTIPPFRKNDEDNMKESGKCRLLPLNVIDFITRFAIASTFYVHGYKAVTGYFHFQDLIILSTRKIGWEISAEATQTLLRIIGWQDILLAAAVLVVRSKVVLYWIAGWGIITACSRITAMGFEAYDMVLVRAANGGLALVLIALYCWYKKQYPQHRFQLSGYKHLGKRVN